MKSLSKVIQLLSSTARDFRSEVLLIFETHKLNVMLIDFSFVGVLL